MSPTHMTDTWLAYAVVTIVIAALVLRRKLLDRRNTHRVERLRDEIGHTRRAATHAAWQRDHATQQRDHAVWEHGQERRLRRSAQCDAEQWRNIARTWMERAVGHLGRAATAESELAEARREIQAFHDTDEAVGALLRQMGPAPETVREEAS